MSARPSGSVWVVNVVIANKGLKSVESDFVIELYKNVVSLENKVGEILVNDNLIESETVRAYNLQLESSDSLGDVLIAHIPKVQNIPECRYDNNIASGLTIHVQVADADGLTDDDYWVLGAIEEAEKPSFNGVPINTAIIGDIYTYQVQAFISKPFNNLRFRLSSAPNGMTIDSLTGEIHWYPRASQAGLNPVSVIAYTDSGMETLAFNIDVPLPVNPHLMLSAEPIVTAFSGQSYEFVVAGLSDVSGPVTISIASAPDGMTITQDQPFDGFYQIDWLPDEANCQHDVTLQLTDSVGTTEQVSFTIDVYNAPKRLNRFQCSVDAEFCPTR